MISEREPIVNLVKRHAQFILQPPEPCQQDCTSKEIHLTVFLFEHDCQIILYHTCSHLHRILTVAIHGQDILSDIKSLVRKQVDHSVFSLAKHAWVALRQITTKLFQKFYCAIEDLRAWVCMETLATTLFDAAFLIGVKFRVVVVQFNPLIPVHCAQSHGNIVLWSITERAVGQGFRGFERPVWVWCGGGPLEV